MMVFTGDMCEHGGWLFSNDRLVFGVPYFIVFVAWKTAVLIFWVCVFVFFFDGVFVSLVSVLVVWFSNHGFFMWTFVTVARSCCAFRMCRTHACERTQSICWCLQVFLMVHKRSCNNNWHLQSHLIIKCAF